MRSPIICLVKDSSQIRYLVLEYYNKSADQAVLTKCSQEVIKVSPYIQIHSKRNKKQTSKKKLSLHILPQIFLTLVTSCCILLFHFLMETKIPSKISYQLRIPPNMIPPFFFFSLFSSKFTFMPAFLVFDRGL